MYLLVAVTAVIAFYVYRKFYCHRFFKRLGIPGPEPHWLFGNTFQLFKEDRHLILSKWTEKYGKFYGFYYGSNPVLVISSTEAVENLCVKQFANFQGHQVLPLQPDPDTEPNNPLSHMLFARGETWKRLRTICSPAFSSGKLKSYMNLISKSQTDLMDLVSSRAKSGVAFDIRECYQYLTIEVIGEVGFGVQFDAIKNEGKGNIILQKLREFLTDIGDPPAIVSVALCLTELTAVFKAFVYTQMKLLVGFFAPAGYLVGAIKQIITQRRLPNARRNDILQMMIDVSEDTNKATNGISAEELKAIGTNTRELSSLKSLTDTEMVAQCLLLFVAGYETTSTALGFASYLLAVYPDIQEKLAADVRKHFPVQDGKFPEIEYETVMNKIPYLDWVCRETLRLYPVGMNVFSRFVVNESNLCGVNIPKSTWAVLVDTWSIHHDKTLWGPVDPSKFYPERFAPENSVSRPDSAWVPFGLGPRTCIGMRLALLEMKITLANLLLRYHIMEPDGGYPGGSLRITSKNGPIAPIDGVKVKLIPRV